MKTKIYIVASMIACCGLCSCNDLIDIYPVENNVADKFYSSEFEINQAVMGVYARLGRNEEVRTFLQFIILWLLKAVRTICTMQLWRMPNGIRLT